MFFGMGYPVSPSGAGMIVYIIGVFYMFAGIAIVCDEFFVPALDELTAWTGVSDDVAGATFMAAGGSAPELFTSLIGTFKESAVGFGTIVGSAVFNVLFVIGMCAIFSKELLVLTWWPLARDSSYYALSLLVLAIFFNDKEIQFWEALILLGMYGGYVFVMKNNKKLYTYLDAKLNKNAKIEPGDGGAQEKTSRGIGGPNIFLKPGNFRAGVLSHLLQDKGFVDRMSRAVVSRIHVGGNLRETFNKIDKDGSGFIDTGELILLLKELEIPHGDSDVTSALETIDTSHDGKISFEEFSVWYGKAETKINNQIADAFAEIDSDGNGFIEKANLDSLINKLGHDEKAGHTKFNIDVVWEEATSVVGGTGDKNKLNREDFKKWYEQSLFYSEKVDNITKEAADTTDAGDGGDDEDSEPLDVSFPEGTWARVNYILLAPLVLSLWLTVPDVRAEGNKKKFAIAFIGSICWIGVYSFLMVEWATMLGKEMGIPDTVMGLTFLAAGTSIPDLLTSVIVARQGHGDMAVSSSIGSNIFDVLVGLPFPWLMYCIVDPSDLGGKVEVQADSLFLSILILFLMLVAVIMTIKLNKWRMTKGLGFTMFVLYAVFVTQDLLRSFGALPSCFIKNCDEI